MILTNTQEGQQLINTVAYAIISEQAPAELTFYVEIRDRYFANPNTFLESAVDEDNPLGFGNGIAIGMLSAAVFPLIAPLLKLLVEEVVKAFGKNAGSEAMTWVESLFSNEKPVKEQVFTAQQLKRIKKEFDIIAKNEASRLQLQPAEVQAVRDAMIVRLLS